MTDKVTAVITVTGDQSSINQLVKALGLIQYLGAVGASRTINLYVDGDGAARLQFQVKGDKVTTAVNVGQFDLDQDEFNLGIGT